MSTREEDVATQPSITVVIPTYNRAHLIATSIRGFLEQSLKPREIIVVDDGSSDDTGKVVREISPAVHYLRKENGGKSSAINLALPYVNSDFVCIFDDDDFPYPDALQTLATKLSQSDGLDFVYGLYDKGVTGSNGAIDVIERARAPAQVSSSVHTQRLYLLRYAYFMLSGCLIRTEALRKAGPFDESLHRSQDYDMCIRLALAGQFSYCGKAVYVLREHDGLRGPETRQHTLAQRNGLWREYDAIIGAKIMNTTCLRDFSSAPDRYSESSDGQRRTALIRRAWVAGSKDRIDTLVSDLVEASALEPGRPLSEEEVTVLRSLADHPYFIAGLGRSKRWMGSLYRRLCSSLGRQMRVHLSASLFRALPEHPRALGALERNMLSLACAAAYAHARLTSRTSIHAGPSTRRVAR